MRSRIKHGLTSWNPTISRWHNQKNSALKNIQKLISKKKTVARKVPSKFRFNSFYIVVAVNVTTRVDFFLFTSMPDSIILVMLRCYGFQSEFSMWFWGVRFWGFQCLRRTLIERLSLPEWKTLLQMDCVQLFCVNKIISEINKRT